MFSFDYRQPADMDSLPLLDAAELRRRVIRAVDGGWRMLAFFGLPETARPGAPAGLCCVLAHDATRTLAALRTPPLEQFPSLTPDCPQAHYFEREMYEQWGLEPVGHPWLKPVRRAPDAEGDGESAAYPFYRADGDEVHEVAVGPVHAGIIEPGHFRFQCYGENVLHLEIALGYQHRGLEAMLAAASSHGPAQTTARRLLLLECAAGDSSVAHATAHCVLWERLTGQDVPERAWLLRRVGLELERLANHCGDLGAIAGDTGFLPTSSWNGRIRGDFLNMTASVCGNRFGRGLLRYGGTAHDLCPEECEDLTTRLRAAGRDARGAVDIMLDAASVRDRLNGTGALNRADARALGLVGVAARACGLPLDARFHAPVSDLPGTEPCLEQSGDVLARALVRSREMDDSLALVEADLSRLAARTGARTAATPPAPPSRLPARKLAVAQVEGWRGEICHLAVTDAEGELLACKIVDPSFHNWPGLALAMRNGQISDFPLCNKSFNLSYCGHDL